MKSINMKSHNTNGRLITFCGLDGSGKTTLIKMFCNSEETEIFLTKQPTGEVRQSKIFRRFMDTPNHEGYEYRSLSLMAASDRVQHANQIILPELKLGKTVISDRYYYSCLANLRARGYRNDQWIYEIAGFMPKPDLAVFIDVPVGIAVKRVRSRADEKDRYIDMELQNQLRKEYLEIAKACGGLVLNGEETPNHNLTILKEQVYKCTEKRYIS
jgi:dTMP kinase